MKRLDSRLQPCSGRAVRNPRFLRRMQCGYLLAAVGQKFCASCRPAAAFQLGRNAVNRRQSRSAEQKANERVSGKSD